MAENEIDSSETPEDPHVDTKQVMTPHELDVALGALKDRALGLLSKFEERRAAAQAAETQRAAEEETLIAGSVEEAKRDELIPLGEPLNSGAAALNLGRMVASNERLFNQILKRANETRYSDTFQELVVIAARVAQVTGGLVAVMHRVDGETRHRVSYESIPPAASGSPTSKNDELRQA